MSPSTVSSTLGQVLAMAGIDIEVFKAHSTQSTSSSKAEVSGFSLTDITKQGLTFQRFYRKSFKVYDSIFQSGILNKQLLREEVKVLTSSFSDKGWASVLDPRAEISRNKI